MTEPPFAKVRRFWYDPPVIPSCHHSVQAEVTHGVERVSRLKTPLYVDEHTGILLWVFKYDTFERRRHDVHFFSAVNGNMCDGVISLPVSPPASSLSETAVTPPPVWFEF